MEQRKVDCTSQYISNLWYNFTSHYNIGFFLAIGKILKFSKVMINNKQGCAFNNDICCEMAMDGSGLTSRVVWVVVL